MGYNGKKVTSNKEISSYNLQGLYENTFESLKEASVYLGVTASTISSCLRGKTKTSCGKIWKYGHSKSALDISLVRTKEPRKTKVVYQYTLDGVFVKKYGSAKDAAEENNLDVRRIYKACSNGKRAGEYLWTYVYGKIHRYHYHFRHSSVCQIRRSSVCQKKLKERKCLCYDKSQNLLETFDSMKEASEKTNTDLSAICNCCRGRRKSAGGYIWRYSLN